MSNHLDHSTRPTMSWISVRGADGRVRMEMRWTLGAVAEGSLAGLHEVPESPAALLAAS